MRKGDFRKKYPVRTDEIIRIMDERKISQAALAKAVRMSPRAINNILTKKSEPLEANLVKIAAILGVRKWRSLIEGYEGETEETNVEVGEVATKTTVSQLLDMRKGMTPEEAINQVVDKLRKSLNFADLIQFEILR